MKTILKRSVQTVGIAGLLVLGFGVWNKAEAANPDTMTLFVTPTGFTYGVTITSPEVQGFDFTSVTIGQTTIATKSITVANAGNTSEFLTMGIVDTTGGGNAWTANATNGFKLFVMQALIQTAQPANASFAGAGNNVPTSAPGTGANKYGQGATPGVNPGTPVSVWLQLQMPSGVSDTGQHTLVLSINGQST